MLDPFFVQEVFPDLTQLRQLYRVCSILLIERESVWVAKPKLQIPEIVPLQIQIPE